MGAFDSFPAGSTPVTPVCPVRSNSFDVIAGAHPGQPQVPCLWSGSFGVTRGAWRHHERVNVIVRLILSGAHPSEHRRVDPGKLIERTQCQNREIVVIGLDKEKTYDVHRWTSIYQWHLNHTSTISFFCHHFTSGILVRYASSLTRVPQKKSFIHVWLFVLTTS